MRSRLSRSFNLFMPMEQEQERPNSRNWRAGSVSRSSRIVLRFDTKESNDHSKYNSVRMKPIEPGNLTLPVRQEDIKKTLNQVENVEVVKEKEMKPKYSERKIIAVPPVQKTGKNIGEKVLKQGDTDTDSRRLLKQFLIQPHQTESQVVLRSRTISAHNKNELLLKKLCEKTCKENTVEYDISDEIIDDNQVEIEELELEFDCKYGLKTLLCILKSRNIDVFTFFDKFQKQEEKENKKCLRLMRDIRRRHRIEEQRLVGILESNPAVENDEIIGSLIKCEELTEYFSQNYILQCLDSIKPVDQLIDAADRLCFRCLDLVELRALCSIFSMSFIQSSFDINNKKLGWVLELWTWLFFMILEKSKGTLLKEKERHIIYNYLPF